jgi:Ca2+-binding EF-hand superfamily protein
VLTVLVLLAVDGEAQRRGGGRRGRGGRNGPGTETTGPRGRDRSPERAPPEPEVKEFLPGFDSPPAPAKNGKKAAGAKPTDKARASPARTPPPDPMKAADEVTALADHQASAASAEEQLLAEHFGLCDLDENGWISLREAEGTLAIDRSEYRRLDANEDGRLDAGEFASERRSLLARLGALPRPEPAREPREPPAAPGPAPEPSTTPGPVTDAPPPSAAPRSEFGAMTIKPGGFLRYYDADRSGGLSGAELEAALLETGLTLSAAQALEVLDRNDSGQLEGGELFPFAWLASKSRSAAPSEGESASAPVPDPVVAEVTPPEPEPRKAGGNHFARLDPDHDGFVGEADLRLLQRPARLDLRLGAVLSALDRDGDGRLSEAEFRAAMGATPR